MVFGPAAGAPLAEPGGLGALVPIGAALAFLLLTGIAWPPGLATALEHIAAIVSP
jgi:hypothetical protein